MLFTLAVAVYLSGCVGQTGEQAKPSAEETAVNECKALCASALNSGRDLSIGPCLSDKVVEDWVCDVAHSPRQAVDNEPANQCSAYVNGTAKHFVEVDTGCNLIRAV